MSGGIAAFKAPEFVRRLRDRGWEVRCVLTRTGERFVAPLALEVVSGHRVYRDEWLTPNGSGEELHVALARWADVLLIAPATARRLAGIAGGWCSDLLDTVALMFSGPIVVAPAMHERMWEHPAVREHVLRLQERGVRLVGPSRGRLASGEIGWGRLVEADEIIAAVELAVRPLELAGIRAVVTAGPTREPLDPVRYLSNRSSGKMGFAMAAELAQRGAEVILVTGPVALPTPPGVHRVDVETAVDMADQVAKLAPTANLCVFSAAVSDFRAARVATNKLKRASGPPRLELVANPDILASAAQLAPHAFRVGFAAEWGDPSSEAQRKLLERNADWIVGNDVSRPDLGFEKDENEVVVFRRQGEPFKIAKNSKAAVARQLVDALIAELKQRAASNAQSDPA